eukprot:TRINITY_DN2027_c0_g1_i1.p1 TRINITY_DN2027_c0_g1~~TRINITY_DN2027_c0_g1_i1.p1  ORF type:complete len:188 (+),score=42.72 TRINITY_DN2027_c0_g1_i1:121-684(+)
MESQTNLFHSEVLEKALEVFATQEKTLNTQLQQIVERISKTGLSSYSWPHLKMLISFRIEQILYTYYDDDPQKEQLQPEIASVLRLLDSFSGPPFTLQRLCELILKPTYKSLRKYLFALEKLLSVSMTQMNLGRTEHDSAVEQLIQSKLRVDNSGDGLATILPTADNLQNGRTEDNKITPMEVEAEL